MLPRLVCHRWRSGSFFKMVSAKSVVMSNAFPPEASLTCDLDQTEIVSPASCLPKTACPPTPRLHCGNALQNSHFRATVSRSACSSLASHSPPFSLCMSAPMLPVCLLVHFLQCFALTLFSMCFLPVFTCHKSFKPPCASMSLSASYVFLHSSVCRNALHFYTCFLIHIAATVPHSSFVGSPS